MKVTLVSGLCAGLLACMASGALAQDNTNTPSNPQAKTQLAPKSVMLQSDLLSAKAQIEGLKSQLSLTQQGAPNADFINQVKMYNKNLEAGIHQAQSQEKQLATALQKNYPQVATSEDVKGLDFAVNDLQSFYKSWSDKISERSYWQDKEQAKADIDSLSKRLDKAIESSRNFNSSQLDIALG